MTWGEIFVAFEVLNDATDERGQNEYARSPGEQGPSPDSFLLRSKWAGFEKKSRSRGRSRPLSTNSVCNSSAVRMKLSFSNFTAMVSKLIGSASGVSERDTSSFSISSSIRSKSRYGFGTSAMLISRDFVVVHPGTSRWQSLVPWLVQSDRLEACSPCSTEKQS